MAFEYFPARAEQQREIVAPKPNWLALLAGALFLSLCFTVGYIIWDKDNSIRKLKNELSAPVSGPVNTANSAKDSLQKELVEVTMRYDMLKTISAGANDTINERDRDILGKTNYIKQLLNKVNASTSEIARAKQMIAALTTDIESFKKSIETLKGEKLVLFNEKQSAGSQVQAALKTIDSARQVIRKQDDVIDIATTLNATGFMITSINEKNNGKERSTVIARQVDKLRISFDVAENHVATSGTKELYVCIMSPDGTPISVEALGSGKFTVRSGEEKFYTQKVDINYLQGNRQTVNFDWKQNRRFEPGAYKIEVFNNGFKIGEGTRYLKK